MKITFLGTNGWYPTATGDTPCILIETNDQYVVLDAGNGFYKLDQYIKDAKPISLFISHFHLDHISGLHMLVKFDFKQGIDIYVGEGRIKDFDALISPPYTVGYKTDEKNVSNLRMQVRLHELSEEYEKIPFPARAVKQFHAYTDHGYKFKLEGKTIAYTGDCGLTDKARELAQDADVLICECNYKKLQQPDEWGHFDPILAATLAKESNVKKLLLTHFGANIYTILDERIRAESVAREIFHETTAAKDGMEIEV